MQGCESDSGLLLGSTEASDSWLLRPPTVDTGWPERCRDHRTEAGIEELRTA